MNKIIKSLSKIFIAILCLTVSGYAGKLVIGATAVPHGEILEFAKPILKKQGIDLKIIEFQDYILPNIALKNKELNANFYQHIVFLENQNKVYNYEFLNAGAIHIEPIGIYSKKYKNLSEVTNNSTVLFSNSVSDRGRILLLLEKAGLITLKKGKDIADLDFEDIINNPKNLKFNNNVDPAILPRAYYNDEADLIIINTNYALGANLNPIKDALFIEDTTSPFANIVVINTTDKNNSDIKTLINVLQSKEVAEFIKDHFKGAIIPFK